MKILCVYGSCGPEFVRRGWGNVFASVGHDFRFWDMSQKPAFDAFDEFEPDIFIGTTFDLDLATVKCIQERPTMKVALVASNWGTFDESTDTDRFPILMSNPREIKLMELLTTTTRKPDIVFCHYSQRWMDVTHDYWNSKLGIKVVSMMNAADVITHPKGTVKPHLISDISFVGGFWGYKGQNLNKYLVPLCWPVGRYSIKIWGNQRWPVPQYMGLCDNSEVSDIFISAKVAPNISEPHSNEYGFDVVERPFKVIAAGGMCISDYVESLDVDIFNGQLPMFNNPREFEELLEYCFKNPEQIENTKKQLQETVMSKHTYFHRVADLLRYLGKEDEALQVEKKYDADYRDRFTSL